MSDIRSVILDVVQYAPMDREILKQKASEVLDVSEEEIQEEIDLLLEEGTLFDPDGNGRAVQRVSVK